MRGSSSAVERRLPKPKVAGSNPVSRSTRLSLDAIRVPGSAFSFAFSLAFMAGYLFCNATPRRSRRCIACGGFFSHRRARSSASPFPKKVTLRLCCFACKRARKRRLATNLFRAMMAWTLYPLKKKTPYIFFATQTQVKSCILISQNAAFLYRPNDHFKGFFL